VQPPVLPQDGNPPRQGWWNVRPWLAEAAHNIRESRTLVALRDTLLPKLLSGELRVKDAERLAADAA
jgi:hypothetical protein